MLIFIFAFLNLYRANCFWRTLYDEHLYNKFHSSDARHEEALLYSVKNLVAICNAKLNIHSANYFLRSELNKRCAVSFPN